MGLDYYHILGVSRNAGIIDLKKAYRRKALQHHPDKSKSEVSAAEFSRICEAYDVLRDSRNKAFYDLYGEDGLKNGIADDDGGRKGGFYVFNPDVDPLRIFAQFFGTKNPYQALEGLSEKFQDMSTREKPKKGKKKMCTMELSLEEIFNGCVKRVTHIRKETNESGETISKERQLTIDVKPGLTDGTMFIFEGEGNIMPNTIPGPVVFVLKSMPHPCFSRSGSNLIHKATIPLYFGLVGSTVAINMLDNRKLSIPFTDIVTPGFCKVISGEGMPKPGGGKGDLIVETDLLFPTSFSDAQKMLLKAAFFLPTKVSPEHAHAIKEFETAFKHSVKGWETGFPKDLNSDAMKTS